MAGTRRLIAMYRTAIALLENAPDTPSAFSRHFAPASRQFAALLLLGLALRCSTFGDPNLHVDESFYLLVGREMQLGAIPYVDIWDRKPIGLFLIYYAITCLSAAVVTYQLVAAFFASVTAMIVNRIAQRWAGVQGGMLAGASYLFMLGPLEGYGGQSPVFYNALIAAAALLLFDSRPDLERGEPGWRVFLAMALAGLALTVKQTALFEAVFFGLVVAWFQLRSGAPALRSCGVLLACATLGAMPTVLSGLVYYRIGHWPEFWHAMVTSNLAKAQAPLQAIAMNALRVVLRIYPLVAMSWLGLWITDREAIGTAGRRLLALWVIVALFGVISVPNFYGHYLLPLLVPLAVTSSIALGRRDIGAFLFGAVAAFCLVLYNPFDRPERRRSIAAMDELAWAIAAHDSGGGLLVFDAPPYLYALANKRPLTPLSFPHHLNHARERNVSHLDTLQEARRILRGKPGVVAMSAFPSNLPANEAAREAVKAYVSNNCRIVTTASSHEINHVELIAIWGDCQDGPPDLAG